LWGTKFFYSNPLVMTQNAIKEQIDATKKVTAKAMQSKEYAQKILTNVGIINKAEPEKSKKEPNNK
jgi:hypothetical protein